MAGAPPGKIAIVSHILPPSPSGQATVLARLLQGIDPDRYILLSRERYDGTQGGEDAGEPLPARYYAFRSPPPVPPAWRLTGSFLRFVGETFVWIRDRARQIEEIARKEGCDVLVACSGDLYDLPAAE